MACLTHQTATIDAVGTILSLTLIDRRDPRPAGHRGHRRLGQHPGPGTDPGADLGFDRIRATVQPAPFDDHARQAYRRHVL